MVITKKERNKEGREEGERRHRREGGEGEGGKTEQKMKETRDKEEAAQLKFSLESC